MAEQPGLTTFANFMLLPQASELSATFQYALPEGVTQTEGDETVYRLTVFKQPGTRPGPLTMSVALPVGAALLEASLPVTEQEGRVVISTTLETNLVVTLRYR